jgi:hypothetical protein
MFMALECLKLLVSMQQHGRHKSANNEQGRSNKNKTFSAARCNSTAKLAGQSIK